MAGIRLEGLRKSHGRTEVLRGIDLEIADGEFMVFVGPSGCAKSTTLRLITGLETPTAGRIWVGGELVNHLPAKERNLAMVFQSYALFPNMTVRGNLSFGMEVRGERKEMIGPEVERIAGLLDLTQHLDKRPAALSGGQAQRVALGRAIIRKPKAFLFDEPLSNLDAELRVMMRSEILSMQRKLGITTIYVTHDQTEAMTMGDRIAVMREGRIMQVGAPLSLYSDPDNLFVASFLGSPKINLFAADGSGHWPAGDAAHAAPGTAVTAGLRAERVRLGGDEGPITAEAVIGRMENLGHEALVWLRPPGAQEGDEANLLTARVEEGKMAGLARGARAKVRYSQDDLFFFDAQGERVRPSNAH